MTFQVNVSRFETAITDLMALCQVVQNNGLFCVMYKE